jgi:hypothetical protein
LPLIGTDGLPHQDLRRLDISPVERLSAKPVDDPLERILGLTSIGVPSVVYETVRDLRQARGQRLWTPFSDLHADCLRNACRDLRQARGQRLGALQRKFPVLGLSLLYVLAALELFAFPLLGAGTAGTTR